MLIFFRIETIDQELLKAIQLRQFPGEGAEQLQDRMQSKRKASLRALYGCAAMVLLAVCIAFTDKRMHYPTVLLMFSVFGLFAAVFVAIFRANAWVIAHTYLKALRGTYPELFQDAPSAPLSERSQAYYAERYAWQQIKVTRRDDQLLDRLSNGRESEDQARFLYNLALEKRKQCCIRMLGFVAAVTVLVLMFRPYAALRMPGWIFGLLGAFVLPVNARQIYWTRRYLQAIRAGYPQLRGL